MAILPVNQPQLTAFDQLIDVATLSAVDPREALKRPMRDLVDATLQAASRSLHTQRAYRTAIGLFIQFLDAQRGDELAEQVAAWRPFALAHKDPKTQKTTWEFRTPAVILRWVSPSLVDNFRAWREEQGDSNNAAQTRLAAVRTFLAVAYRDRILTDAQAQSLHITAYKARQSRHQKTTGRRLSPEEVRTLRQAIDSKRVKGQRDLAILDAMLFLGLRRDEVAHLETGDFRQENGRWWLNLIGKGDKPRRLKVHDTFFKTLSIWLANTAFRLGDDTTGAIFVGVNRGGNLTGNQINGSVIGRLVTEYGHKAGLAPASGKNCLSPHDLRRTCARNAYDNKAPLLLIQQMLGHSDPKTTANYIGIHENDDDTAVDYVRY